LATGRATAPGFLGLQRVDKSRSTIAFRMDDRKQRIIVNCRWRGGLSTCSAWGVADATALEALAAKLEAANVKSRVARARWPTSGW
jgi:hypothetical protein